MGRHAGAEATQAVPPGDGPIAHRRPTGPPGPAGPGPGAPLPRAGSHRSRDQSGWIAWNAGKGSRNVPERIRPPGPPRRPRHPPRPTAAAARRRRPIRGRPPEVPLDPPVGRLLVDAERHRQSRFRIKWANSPAGSPGPPTGHARPPRRRGAGPPRSGRPAPGPPPGGGAPGAGRCPPGPRPGRRPGGAAGASPSPAPPGLDPSRPAGGGFLVFLPLGEVPGQIQGVAIRRPGSAGGGGNRRRPAARRAAQARSTR